jgi:hypothetical protein
MPIIDKSRFCALPQTEKLCYRAAMTQASQSGLFLGLPVSLIPRTPHASQISYYFGRLLDDSLRNEIPEAYADLSDHTLPITDIACGFGPFPSCRVLTASTDHSVKVCLHFSFKSSHAPQLIAPKVMGPRIKVTPNYFPVSSCCHPNYVGCC